MTTTAILSYAKALQENNVFLLQLAGKSHKKHQIPHIANFIKCMNVDSEREDSKEMSKEKVCWISIMQ
jgi:hypothetical protein